MHFSKILEQLQVVHIIPLQETSRGRMLVPAVAQPFLHRICIGKSDLCAGHSQGSKRRLAGSIDFHCCECRSEWSARERHSHSGCGGRLC